jgi:hypothetical protein
MTIATLLLNSSNPGGFILWCLIGICAGIYLFVQGFRLLQRRRLILDTPASKIRSASMGMVELNGLAVGPYTMVAPITARPCYCYRTFVWEWKQCGKNKQWVKVAAECMHVPPISTCIRISMRNSAIPSSPPKKKRHPTSAASSRATA